MLFDSTLATQGKEARISDKQHELISWAPPPRDRRGCQTTTTLSLLVGIESTRHIEREARAEGQMDGGATVCGCLDNKTSAAPLPVSEDGE